jgi:hypothetical protein
MAFRVKGNHMHGGRGLAFWYAKDSKESGPVFGSKDKWDGLSVWLDSANPLVKIIYQRINVYILSVSYYLIRLTKLQLWCY